MSPEVFGYFFYRRPFYIRERPAGFFRMEEEPEKSGFGRSLKTQRAAFHMANEVLRRCKSDGLV
jgi:hypothetical protein